MGRRDGKIELAAYVDVLRDELQRCIEMSEGEGLRLGERTHVRSRLIAIIALEPTEQISETRQNRCRQSEKLKSQLHEILSRH
jgi:hypothetical protein